MMLKIEDKKELNNLYSMNNKLKKIDVIVEILNEYLKNSYTTIYAIDEDKIEFIDDVDEYFIDELFDEIGIEFKYLKIDVAEQYYLIKIDDDEFIKKDLIESYDDLLKYIHENILIDKIKYDVVEFDDKFNYIAMNEYYDYLHQFHYLITDYYKFNLDKYVDVAEDLFNKFIKIFDYEFNDDIELYEDIFELYNDDDIELYKNYDIELFNESFILINHNNRSIRNLNYNDMYNLIVTTISSYLKLNDNSGILYDDIIKLLNIMSYTDLIIEFNDELYNLSVEYHYEYYKINDMNKLLEFINGIDDINYVFNYSGDIDIKDIQLINYEDIIEFFNVDVVVEFIDENVEIDYDCYNYENYIALNDLFYDIYINNHLKTKKN